MIPPEIIQNYLDIEVGMGLTLGSLIVITMASTLGLPFLSQNVRERVFKPKSKPPTNET